MNEDLIFESLIFLIMYLSWSENIEFEILFKSISFSVLFCLIWFDNSRFEHRRHLHLAVGMGGQEEAADIAAGWLQQPAKI